MTDAPTSSDRRGEGRRPLPRRPGYLSFGCGTVGPRRPSVAGLGLERGPRLRTDDAVHHEAAIVLEGAHGLERLRSEDAVDLPGVERPGRERRLQVLDVRALGAVAER